MGMAMGRGTAIGGGRRRRRSRAMPMSEINVTPFVDVMLVLLIIFMVAAPLLTVGVPIDLPESKAKPLEGMTKPVTISVRPDGVIFLQDTEIVPDELIDKLLVIAANGYDERLYVRGDKSTDYGLIMKIMGQLSSAGFRKIGLVTELENQ